MMLPAAGPLGRVLGFDGGGIKARAGYRIGAEANALVMVNRLAFPAAAVEDEPGRFGLDDTARQALLAWAASTNLGQQATLVQRVHARRTRLLQDLRRQGRHVVRMVAEPEWRLAVGLGDNANAHEIGFALHGTYGWPVIPGSSLKGMAAAWATAHDDSVLVDMIFGSPRRGARERSEPARGGVCFLDAIPAGRPANVVLDVLTPHVKPYYDNPTRPGRRRDTPPAEYHQPVPVYFLTVTGRFAVDVFGADRDEVDCAAEWLAKAATEAGAGAKTNAGYGYLNLKPAPLREVAR